MKYLLTVCLILALQSDSCNDTKSTENPYPADVKPTPIPKKTLLVNGDDAVIETRHADNSTSYEPVEVDR